MSSHNNLLEEIKSRLDIVDVISDYVPLKKAGQNWKGLCPFHSEKIPSFMVSPSKQIFHCFGCGIGGDVFTFIMKFENYSFQESLTELAKRAGVEIKKSHEDKMSSGEREILLNLHRDALLFYQRQLSQNQDAGAYLKDRGITEEIQALFAIGYAPKEWDALLSYLRGKDYKIDMILKAGLINKGVKGYYDTFRDRIIFPIFNNRGEVIAFGGRAMDDSIPKYLNSPETPIFSKSRTLYGLNLAKDAIRKEGFVIFVEGYFDVITAHMHGFKNTLAPLGTAVTKEQGRLVRRFTDNAIVVFDGDASGLKAARNCIGILLESGLNVRALPLPEGEDPDSFLRKRGRDAFSEFLNKAVSIVEFFIMQEEDRHIMVREFLEIIAQIPDGVRRGEYVKELSERLNINEVFIMEELRRIIKRSRIKDVGLKKEDIPEVPGDTKPMDERYILQIILHFPEMRERLFKAVSIEDFEDPTIRGIIQKIKTGLVDYNDLIYECNEQEKGLLTGLLLKDELEDPEKVFEDCLRHLKSRKRQRQLEELQEKIREAELQRDEDLLRNLLQEKQQILKLKV
jgi:DNA primase